MKAFPAIAIASGKGGTGKTTVAIHLAALLAAQGRAVQYLDCDVEEPNGHLFLKPKMERSESVGIPVPVVDAAQCTSCGKCAEVCEFNAIAMLKKPLVFPELCHGCGACALVCPVGAIRETSRAIGVVETGRTGTIGFAQGRLNVGEPMAPPLIRAVKARRNPDAIALFDSPPGTSCPVVATVRDADLVVLVTEPTPFGLHDLSLAVATLRPLGRPLGVVVNRADDDRRVQDYCQAENLPVLAELPDDRRVAETYARGELVFDRLPEWRDRFDALWSRIEECL
ncbi:MAG TPA: ATP-binding protein [Kiritimatiellia bacterium]|nr:ATP-binding protein [Kiritimatiellia bacterium]HPC19955.1 ATP-binding protein [Kiritimatiellia bacterium]HQN79705.1 ATP-binding protein [Kiritimatiellia bacterium]HQQ60601.1 ATP-binding protein [Kiritimatiellia bacterium]